MGGMESFMDALAREQASNGHDIMVLAHWHQTKRPTENVQLLDNLSLIRVSIKGVLVHAPMAPGMPGMLNKTLKNYKPDVVHVHMPNLSAFFLLWYKMLPRLVIHWHSDVVGSEHEYRLKLFYPVYRLFEKRLIQKSHAIIATSESYLKSSQALSDFQNKCTVTPLGISLEKMKELAYTSQDSEERQALLKRLFNDFSGDTAFDFVLSVGRFTYYKGFKYLLEACRLGFNGRLIIVGDGPLWREINSLRLSLGLTGQVSMPGSLQDKELHWLLYQCSAFCLPSIERTEAFGMVLLEAMYYKKPLITTRVAGSGMNEVNIHGQTGLVVSPASPHDLSRAMGYILSQKKEAERMGRNARERLEKKFTISDVAHNLEQVYQV